MTAKTPEGKHLALAVLYWLGMARMPRSVQAHLRLCHNKPADCLICKMTQLQIEATALSTRTSSSRQRLE